MKAKLMLVAALVVGSAGVQAGASQNEFNPEVYRALVSICADTQDDDRFALKKTLQAHRVGVKAAVDKVVCNGKPLAAFARAEQSHKVAKFLAPYENRGKGHVDIKDIAAPN